MERRSKKEDEKLSTEAGQVQPLVFDQRELPPGADEFTSFLKSYLATWAGRTGVL
jgi:hypothetical protein